MDMLISEFSCDPMIKGYQKRSLLHFACGIGNTKLVNTLVHKFNFTPVTDLDANNFTPLHIAACCGQTAVAIMLLTKNKCQIDCKSSGEITPLHMACFGGHLSVVKIFVSDFNANLNAHDLQNSTPLHLWLLGLSLIHI